MQDGVSAGQAAGAHVCGKTLSALDKTLTLGAQEGERKAGVARTLITALKTDQESESQSRKRVSEQPGDITDICEHNRSACSQLCLFKSIVLHASLNRH